MINDTKKEPGEENAKFNSVTFGELEIKEVINHIKNFLETDEKAGYSLVIGSDSQERKLNDKRVIDIVTAVIVYKKRSGGRYFWMKQKDVNVYSLRDKINKETLTSLTFATTFVPMLNESLNGKKLNYDLEIHVDVGENGDTRNMIKEVVAMVNGNGFVAKTKPEAYGASYVADRYT
ncbi:MAG: ribonuclease H-like YkuK family protein [bacterium]|nr:ribonuclease H-like YkuK family protein [bacterium]